MSLCSIHGSFQHLTNFLKTPISLILRLDSCNRHPASFFTILIITHNIKLFKKSENLFVFPSSAKILNDIFW